ncbi:tonB-system energizer ExbB [Pararhizobium gei]|uniref:tonB-system energizer ExbB n=1 Tax=Pararhizobium gei TaxID=1395951 RepID=UPI0023DBF8A1|nr:tonB-system energizer ExbB [Rhizobium gei]
MASRPISKFSILALTALVMVSAAPVQAQENQAPAAEQTQDVQTAPAGQMLPSQQTMQAIPADSASPAEAEGVAPPEGNPGLPHDLSPVGMFLAADIVVKIVMSALALASVATWAILVFKVFELSAARRKLKRAVRLLTEAIVLRDIGDSLSRKFGPAGTMFAAALTELSKSEAVLDVVPAQGIKERLASQLQRIEAGAGKRIASGTGILATIGSISPFVGLFGTVWGIMNSFIGISQAQTTNLAIVAPGIAEALLATAIGLVAAIPAVVIYNYFSRAISGYRLLLADASAAVEQLVSRDLDFRQARRIAPRKSEPHAHADIGIARIG